MDLQRLLAGGFKIGDSFIREPQSIRSYASLACIALDY
jgi:ribonucleoside-triphosphate reductase